MFWLRWGTLTRVMCMRSYISRIWEIPVFPIRFSDIPTILIFPTIPVIPVIPIFLTILIFWKNRKCRNHQKIGNIWCAGTVGNIGLPELSEKLSEKSEMSELPRSWIMLYAFAGCSTNVNDVKNGFFGTRLLWQVICIVCDRFCWRILGLQGKKLGAIRLDQMTDDTAIT